MRLDVVAMAYSVKSPGNPTNTVITQDKCNVIQLSEMALLCIYFFRPQTFRVEKNRRLFCDLMSSSR